MKIKSKPAFDGLLFNPFNVIALTFIDIDWPWPTENRLKKHR